MTSTSSNEHEITQSQWEGLDINLTTDNGNVGSQTTASYLTLYYTYPIARIALYIHDNYLYILISIGVPCNILSFLVLRRIKPVTSATYVMLMLAVANSLLLCVECTNKVTRIAGVSYKNIGCSFLMTFRLLLQYYPIWLVVLLTLERVVVVCFPLRANSICTLSNARRSVIFLFILDCLISSVHTFIYEERYHWSYGYECYVKSKYKRFYTLILSVVDALLFVFTPLILLFQGNIAIIIKLRTWGDIYSSPDITLTQERKRQNRSVTIMLLAFCITTCVCLLPNAVYSISGLAILTATSDADIRTAALKDLATCIIFVCTYTNNPVNFFLYIMTGKRFRSVLREMIISWFFNEKAHGERT